MNTVEFNILQKTIVNKKQPALWIDPYMNSEPIQVTIISLFENNTQQYAVIALRNRAYKVAHIDWLLLTESYDTNFTMDILTNGSHDDKVIIMTEQRTLSLDIVRYANKFRTNIA